MEKEFHSIEVISDESLSGDLYLQHCAQQTIEALLAQNVSAEGINQFEWQRSGINQSRYLAREGRLTKADLEKKEIDYTDWLFLKLRNKLNQEIAQTKDNKIRQRLENFAGYLLIAKEALFSPTGFRPPIPDLEIQKEILADCWREIGALPRYLDQIGRYQSFFGADRLTDEPVSEETKSKTTKTSDKALETLEAKREIQKADPLFEKLEKGLNPDDENNLLRRVDFGEPGEIFYIGKIETENPAIFEQMFITGIWNLRGDGLLERVTGKHQKIELPKVSQLGARQRNEADISLPINRQSDYQTVAIPTPKDYRIIGLEENLLIEQSNFNTWRISNLPPEITEIHYRLAPTDEQINISAKDRDRFQEDYSPQYLQRQTRTTDELVNEVSDPETKIKLIVGGAKANQPIYSFDPFLGEIYQAAEDCYLAHEAMQMGHCDSLSVYLANRLRHHQMPALVVSGLTTSQDEKAFAGNVGHSQVLYFDPSGKVKIIEATSLTEKDKAVDFSQIPQEEKAKLLEDVALLPKDKLFRRLSEFSQKIRPEKVNWELVREQSRNLPPTSFAAAEAVQPDKNAEGFLKVMSFINQWQEAKEASALTLAKIQDFIAAQNQLDWSWMDASTFVFENFRDDKVALKKYQEQTKSERWQQEMVEQAKLLFDHPKTSAEEKVNFQGWAFQNSFSSSKLQRKFLSSTQALDFINENKVAELADSTHDLANIAINILNNLSYITSEDPPESQNYWQEKADKVLGLSQKMLERISGGEKRVYNLYKRDYPNDLLSRLGRLFQESNSESYQSKVSQTLANLIKASIDPERDFCELVFPYDRDCYYKPEKLRAIFVGLAKSLSLAEWLDESGKLTPQAQEIFTDYFYNHWLNFAGRYIPLPEEELLYLQEMGLNLGQLFSADRVIAWIEQYKSKRPPWPKINFALTKEGEPDFDHPISWLLTKNTDYYAYLSNFRPNDLNLLQTLFNINRLVWSQSTENKDFDRVREAWGETDEETIFQEYLADATFSWDDNNNRLNLLVSSSDSQRNWFHLPLSLPQEITAARRSQSLYLKKIQATFNDTAMMTAENQAWQRIYNQYPTVKESIVEKLVDKEKEISQQVRHEAIVAALSPTERYLAMLAIDQIFRNAKKGEEFQAKVEKLKHLTGECLALPNEVTDQKENLATAVEQLEESNLTPPNEYQETRQLLELEPAEQRFKTYLLLGDVLANAPENADFDWLIKETKGDLYFPQIDRRVVLRDLSIDQETGPIGQKWADLISDYQLPRGEMDEYLPRWLNEIRRGTVEPGFGGGQTTYTRFLKGLIGQKKPIQSAGGEYLQHRAYSNDDVRYVDWNVYARLNDLQTKMMNEQKINDIHLLVDAEWLAESLEEESKALDRPKLPKNIRNLFKLFYLAFKERVPINFHLCFRGEKLFSLSSDQLRQGLDHLQYQDEWEQERWQDEQLVLRFYKIASGVKKLLAKEEKEGISYPEQPVISAKSFSQSRSIPKVNASVFGFSSRANLSPSAGFLERMNKVGAKDGLNVQLAQISH